MREKMRFARSRIRGTDISEVSERVPSYEPDLRSRLTSDLSQISHANRVRVALSKDECYDWKYIEIRHERR